MMAKGLKGFVRTRASKDEADLVAREIMMGSPRAAALVAGAFLDNFLAGLILRHLVELTPSEIESLFEPDRPLGSFSAKIRMARALGIFGPKTAHDLNIVRDIRNAFAHGLRRMNFETPEVKQLLASFYCLRDIPSYKRFSSRKLFFEVTANLSTHLHEKAVSSSDKRVPPKLTVFCAHLD
jgi:DNA-binding MltR family transcriptional regulator